MDHLPKFHLNRTVNEPEMQFYENCMNQKNWWRLTPRIRRLAPGGTKLLPDGYCCAKSTKTTFFMNQHTTHL